MSLLQHLDENGKINEIRLSIRHPTGKFYVWVLVEGETDQKLYNKLINGNNVKVEMVPGGIECLRKAISILIVESSQVLGVRDADFLHMDNQAESTSYLFLTDAHDSEMMMVSCDKAFEAIVSEFSTDRLGDSHAFRGQLLASLAFLGGLRWINNTECLELNFESGLSKFFDKEHLTIDKLECIKEIEKCSPNKKRSIQIAEINEIIANVSDYYNLCNGHDFEKAFALHITTKRKKGVNPESIGSHLRAAYRIEDFVATNLYQQLKDWESQTGCLLFSDS